MAPSRALRGLPGHGALGLSAVIGAVTTITAVYSYTPGRRGLLEGCSGMSAAFPRWPSREMVGRLLRVSACAHRT